MAEVLSREWWDTKQAAWNARADLPAADGVVELRITERTGDTVSWVTLRDGAIVSVDDVPAAEADLSLAAPRSLAEQLLSGEVDPAVAYMQGRLKMAGNMQLWLALLPTLRAIARLQ